MKTEGTGSRRPQQTLPVMNFLTCWPSLESAARVCLSLDALFVLLVCQECRVTCCHGLGAVHEPAKIDSNDRPLELPILSPSDPRRAQKSRRMSALPKFRAFQAPIIPTRAENTFTTRRRRPQNAKSDAKVFGTCKHLAAEHAQKPARSNPALYPLESWGGRRRLSANICPWCDIPRNGTLSKRPAGTCPCGGTRACRRGAAPCARGSANRAPGAAGFHRPGS